jgi:hypothetical protein
LIMLRPCPKGAIPPYELDKVVGKRLINDLDVEEAIEWSNLK